MENKYTKKYQVITAYCFHGTKVHIQPLHQNTAKEAIQAYDINESRSVAWKAEGTVIYENSLSVIKVYGHGGVSIIPISLEELRAFAAEEERGVS